jgi:esterase/lipase superfamily enzyme
MRGSATLLSDFIEGNKVQFIIPVYQRNYDWLIENCDQLFYDLVKLNKSSRSAHFFGSIVTTIADGFGHNRLVIDGQQRLTTISLLLLAGIQAVKDKKLSVSNESKLEEAYDVFLIAKHAIAERKIKLIPIENDLEAYDRIFNNDSLNFIEGSKMTRNYRHFYDLLTHVPNVLTFDELLDCIERLQIIAIELESQDDAQLIFESLNSTGLALTEADKVRNYLLMSLSANEQQYCFKEYWQNIELATEREPTMFLRDYLTIKQQMQRPVRLSNIYSEWKRYMQDRDRKHELAQMLDYSRYYQQITTAQLCTERLSNKMRHICNIDTDVANVFFIQFLKYANEKSLTESEIYDVIDIIENYLARRIVCNIPSNALTQVFCALHKDVLKSIEEYESSGIELNSSYSQILTYHIMRRDGNYQLPKDIQFIDAIKTRDAYHMNKQFQIFIFERLENSIPGEYNDVATDMKKKDATIEHIMPQTLTDSWIESLGSNHEAIKEKYLHTFANLTLTGINSTLSNKPFITKRDGETLADGTICPGYKDSKYRLTRSVTACSNWSETELNNRSQEIVNIFLRLYPIPQSTFKPLPKAVEEVTLEEEAFSPTSRVLKGFRIYGKEYVENTWKGMLIQVVRIVSERYPDIVDTLYDKESYFWTSKSVDIRYCTQIGTDKYLWTSVDNKGKLRTLRYLFEKCDIASSELTLFLEPLKDV